MALKMAMITQVVDEDDPVLGFTCGWIRALAAQVDALDVVCLREGRHDLRGNVNVLVMPKGRVRRYLFLRRYLKSCLRNRTIDAILVHMCPIYAVVAGSILKGRIPVGLWYVHSSVTSRLKKAISRSQVLFTCLAKNNMRVSEEKLLLTGHGIDIEKFQLRPYMKSEGPFRIISVGRITRVKRYETMISALRFLKEKLTGGSLQYDIYGPKLNGSDDSYAIELMHTVKESGLSGVVSIHGPIPYPSIQNIYREADMLVNMTPQSYDKVALEACACGVPVLATNDYYAELFGRYADTLIAHPHDPEGIAAKIECMLNMKPEEREEIGCYLRAKVVSDHSLDGLMKRIVAKFESLQ